MKDKNGVYYFPFPQNKRVRMYVREDQETVCFRLWNADDDQMWEAHGWVPYGAIREAAAMYDKNNFDPDNAYDIDVARAVLKEHPA